MSPAPPPTPGLYPDSCGAPYAATLHPKTGWWLQKRGRRPFGGPDPPPFQRPDFPAAVHAGLFTFASTP